MSLSRDEAASALKDIAQTQKRSATAYAYQMSAPHLIWWGVIWFLGYGATYAAPGAYLSWAWPALSLVGVAGSFVIGRRSKGAAIAGFDWRYGATVLAVFLFFCAMFAVMPPRDFNDVGAFFPVFVALYYALVGIWTPARRMLVLGIAVGALTLVGFFAFPQIFALWMAIVGGGGLVLGGFWLRTV
jgi:hypothetical protein